MIAPSIIECQNLSYSKAEIFPEAATEGAMNNTVEDAIISSYKQKI